MYLIKKDFKFEAGHRLSKHQGLCHNCHGHSYKIQVVIECEKLNENDMVIDFSDLKQIVNKVLDKYDHALMLNKSDVNSSIEYYTTKLVLFEGDPTAELISESLFYEILDELLNFTRSGEKKEALEKLYQFINIKEVTVWETETSSVTYHL